MPEGERGRMKNPSASAKGRDGGKGAIEDILRLGVKALDEQRAADAERFARDALTRDPRHPEALHLLGLTLLAQGRAREAVAPLEAAARDRASSALSAHLGKALAEVGRTDEALVHLQHATEGR